MKKNLFFFAICLIGMSSIFAQNYYVSSQTGSNRNDGSKGAPFKNLQKALDVCEAGATIYVAEGNYYGLLNKGNIIITKPVTIKGGYSSDFSQRDVLQYRSMVQPTPASNGSASGNGTIQIRSVVAPTAKIIIDGLIMDRGNSIAYNAKGEGRPEGVASPQMNPIGTAGIGGANLDEQVSTTETALIYFDGYQGVVNNVNVEVRNCAFINCPNYGIVGMLRGGSLTVDNCIFVNVRMATMDVNGADAKSVIPITFTNNTVLFVWARQRDLGDMGYGYRMKPGTTNTISNNIFGCATFAALDRTHVDSNREREALRKDAVKGNIFFLNRQTDLTLPGGGMFLRVSANDFDDVEQLDQVSGNRILTDASVFNGKIDKAYLAGFLGLKVSSNMSVDYNSSANQFRSALGMNIQGSGTTTTTMFANRYPWEEALKLFGAVNGCGAQNIRN
ncbi:MAG: DUF1565 domain-containing protein [Bacteroidales bacterium]|nr:DUF1565 domain-containing protein [Bacteroidales bacterium]